MNKNFGIWLVVCLLLIAIGLLVFAIWFWNPIPVSIPDNNIFIDMDCGGCCESAAVCVPFPVQQGIDDYGHTIPDGSGWSDNTKSNNDNPWGYYCESVSDCYRDSIK